MGSRCPDGHGDWARVDQRQGNLCRQSGDNWLLVGAIAVTFRPFRGHLGVDSWPGWRPQYGNYGHQAPTLWSSSAGSVGGMSGFLARRGVKPGTGHQRYRIIRSCRIQRPMGSSNKTYLPSTPPDPHSFLLHNLFLFFLS